jgi:hypothetical protein
MKRLYFALALFAALGCSGLEAQTTFMNASIPFDFQIGKTPMPAGQYDVNCSGRVLMIREHGGSHVAIVLTIPTSRAVTPGTGMLEFNRYGDTYYFAQIWTPNSREGGALLKTPREKELARQGGPIQPTAIALWSK